MNRTAIRSATCAVLLLAGSWAPSLVRAQSGSAGTLAENPAASDNAIGDTGAVRQVATAAPAADSLPKPIFLASFDGTPNAQVARGDGRLRMATTTDRQTLLEDWTGRHLSVAAGEGRYGDALRFTAKAKEVPFYQGIESGYSPQNWSGTVSMWLKLDPNKDLEPGYCDPLQITERAWNDGAFFVDFDKELPRDFRLGVFADLKFWNPNNTAWEALPVAQRPMVVVKQPPFASDQWTHVCFTWSDVNSASGSESRADFYLNGQHQGTLQRPLKFTWDKERAAMMLGINYIGLMDELSIFSTPLDASQVQQLFQLEGGLQTLLVQ